MNLDQFASSRSRLRVGYFGGSITQGTGASHEEHCYRSLITSWLRERYPHVAVEEINAAIGGTGSNLGAFRMERDLLAHQPDFVFVEFAVNDFRLASTARYMETIVRGILTQNPETPLVFLYTTTGALNEESYALGQLPVSVIRQQEVAEYYHIPTVNMGQVLYNTLVAEGSDIRDYTIDTVHPNDRGHRLYADVVCSTLPTLELACTLPEKPLNAVLSQAHMVFPEQADGWDYERNQEGSLLPGFLFSDTPGATLTLDFEGTAIGLYFAMRRDSGDLVYTIDDGEEQRCSTWDHYCKEFDRYCYQILSDSLSPGSHRLQLAVSPTAQPESTGRMIRLAAYLVG